MFVGMKKIAVLFSLLILPVVSAMGQIIPSYENFRSDNSSYNEVSFTFDSAAEHGAFEKSNQSIEFKSLEYERMERSGKTLLICAGALSAAGVAMYISSWTMTSDSSSIGSVFSIAGLSCAGISIPLYICGASKLRKSHRID